MILDRLAEATQARVDKLKEKKSLEAVRQEAEAIARRQQAEGLAPKSLYKALKAPGLSYICEVKKASPSKGLIAPTFDYLRIAGEYEAAGAAAISCLTEPDFFLGSDLYLEQIAERSTLPVLRKDFTLEPYQIYEAKVLGAGAVLLICALLSSSQLQEYLQLAKSLGLDALVEAHEEAEVEQALRAEARIIGVNNRNLKDFTVDLGTSCRLRALVPKDRAFVAESGIKTHEDIKRLEQQGVDGVLIGEALMRSKSIAAALRALQGA